MEIVSVIPLEITNLINFSAELIIMVIVGMQTLTVSKLMLPCSTFTKLCKNVWFCLLSIKSRAAMTRFVIVTVFLVISLCGLAEGG